MALGEIKADFLFKKRQFKFRPRRIPADKISMKINSNITKPIKKQSSMRKNPHKKLMAGSSCKKKIRSEKYEYGI